MDHPDDESDEDRLRKRRGSVEQLHDFHAVAAEHGHFPMLRYIGQVDGEDAFEGFAAKLIGDPSGGWGQLRIAGETFLLNMEHLVDAVTDPATYDPDEDGPPHPIDVLRDPPQPE